MVELSALDSLGHRGQDYRLGTSLAGPMLQRLPLYGIDDSVTKQREALSQ